MPLYEYQCDACGHRFEVIQKHSDPPIEKCPVCGKTVHKLQSAPAFQFKGTGWYVTDYARKDGAKPADGASGEGTKEKTEKTGKSESAEKTGSTAAASKSSDASSSSKTSGKQS